MEQVLFCYLDLKMLCQEQGCHCKRGMSLSYAHRDCKPFQEFLHWRRELEAVRQEQAAPLVEDNAQLRARIAELEAAARLQQGELEAARREASELREQCAQVDQMVENLQRCALVLHTVR